MLTGDLVIASVVATGELVVASAAAAVWAVSMVHCDMGCIGCESHMLVEYIAGFGSGIAGCGLLTLDEIHSYPSLFFKSFGSV